MSIILTQNIVLIGSFNVELFEPKWLIKQKIIQDEIYITVNLENKKIQYHNKKEGYGWEIENPRFVIFPLNSGETFNSEKVSFLPKIFKILEYTPVNAIGYNIIYKLSDNIVDKIQIELKQNEQFFNKLTGDKQEYKANEIKSAYKYEDYIIEIALRDDGTNEKTLRFNFEKQINENDPKEKIISNFINKMSFYLEYSKKIATGGCYV